MSYESEFMCIHDEEGAVECAEIRARARAIMERRSPCENDLDFVDRMLYWLALEGDLHIAADMWAGVSMTPAPCSECGGFGQVSWLDEDDYTVWGSCPKCEALERYAVKKPKSFQCDSIVDGLAALVVFYFEGVSEEP